MNPDEKAFAGSDLSSQEVEQTSQETKVSGPSYLTVTNTLTSWMFTLDHKRIGLMYLVGVLSMFLLGGVFALLVRTELFSPIRLICTTSGLRPTVRSWCFWSSFQECPLHLETLSCRSYWGRRTWHSHD